LLLVIRYLLLVIGLIGKSRGKQNGSGFQPQNHILPLKAAPFKSYVDIYKAPAIRTSLPSPGGRD
jgi:hypothetical protein